jgi:uncharacterized protein (DUF2147 family)
LRLGICLAIFVAMTSFAWGKDGYGVTGRWLTEDGKGIIAITTCGASICGKIDWMRPPLDAAPGSIPLDKHNPNPALRQHPICGLQIIFGFRRDNDQYHWVEGSIYDPQSGNTYHANITLQDINHLRLRGYIGIPLLGESQIWTRAGETYPTCRAS